MEDYKKNRDDGFFPFGKGNETRQNDRDDTEPSSSSEQQSVYYSYGPYKSGFRGNEPYTTSVSDSGGVSKVEISAPRPVRPFGTNISQQPPADSNRTWQFGGKKRSSFTGIFISFLAGALVVGSLMFASDKMNWFTGRQSYATGTTVQNSSGSDGGVMTTSLIEGNSNVVAQIAQKANPAVVLIDSYARPKSRGSSLFDDPFFRQFFGDGFFPRVQMPETNSNALQKIGAGSGFIYNEEGYILTNEHVIEGAEEIQVTVEGHTKPFKAKVLGSSYDYDLAVLKIEGDKPFPTLPLGNADEMKVGDWVIAIGNPYGFEHTVTVGVLSAKERPITIQGNRGERQYKHLLQTDASINPGNSGGPLLNLNGQVIGINTAVSAQAQGIGFAIPTTTISALLDKLETGAEIPKEPSPFIGVALQDIDESWLKDLKLQSTEGSLIVEVPRGTPAFRAGIRQYDVIVKMNGEKIINSADLKEKIAKAKVGEEVTFTIIRDGQTMDITVTVGDRNAETDSGQ